LILPALFLVTTVRAQDPITLIIKEGVKKVIKAVDLKIQRLQNRTIWLQNAQKTLENAMSKAKLSEISDWVERHRTLYRDYFQELSEVKSVVAYYHKVRSISEKQLALVREYRRVYDRLRGDSHFTPGEVLYMGEVYTGIIQQSLKNLEDLSLVIHSFQTQMSDAARMERIDRVETALQQNYDDLRAFNSQNIRLALARAKDQRDVQFIKTMYGLQ